jgi:hypothetical protein
MDYLKVLFWHSMKTLRKTTKHVNKDSQHCSTRLQRNRYTSVLSKKVLKEI